MLKFFMLVCMLTSYLVIGIVSDQQKVITHPFGWTLYGVGFAFVLYIWLNMFQRRG